MNKIVLSIAICFISLISFSQTDMTVYNTTTDVLIVQARATLNGRIIGFSSVSVAPNSSGSILGVSSLPNARWELVRGIDLRTRRKYALSAFSRSSNIQNRFIGLYIAWNSNNNVLFY